MSQPEAPSIDVLRQHCKALSLPTAVQIVGETLDIARREDWPLETFLHHLLEQELAGREYVDPDFGKNRYGQGRQIFAPLRKDLLGAEEGGSSIFTYVQESYKVVFPHDD